MTWNAPPLKWGVGKNFEKICSGETVYFNSGGGVAIWRESIFPGGGQRISGKKIKNAQ